MCVEYSIREKFMSISSLFQLIQDSSSLIIILIFAGIPILIGSAASNRSVSTISDFFLCNRSLGTVLSFCTIYATWWSSFAFLGSTSSFYTQGPLYWIALGWNVLFAILFYVFGKPLWRESLRCNYRTPIDFFHDKYHCQYLDIIVGMLMICLSIPYISVQFLGGGIIIEMATNGLIPWRVSALLFSMIMIIYIWSGGLRAIAWTDTLYCALIFAGMLLIGILFTHMAGGVEATFSTLAKTRPENLHLPAVVDGTRGVGFWFSLLIIMPLGELMMPQIWVRTYAIKASRTFDVMPLLLSIATLAYLGTMLAGNAAAVLEPNYPGASDYILPAMLIKYLPPVLMAFIICCAAAACLSTANSQLHSISGILTLDVYKRFLGRKTPEKYLILVAKGAILLVAALAYLLLLLGNLSTIFQTAFLSFSGVIQLSVPALAGLFYKKGDARSALGGLLIGLCITFVFSLWKPFTFPVSPGIIGLACNAGYFFTMSVIRNNSQQKKVILSPKKSLNFRLFKNKSTRKLWAAIGLCFILMISPLVPLLDYSDLNIAHIPILYIFVFVLWVALCLLAFIGWRMRWGEEHNHE